jgi:transcriptional regulator GlxA family with amidase domain
MAQAPVLHRIGVLAYPGAQQAAVHGLRDLFEIANRLQSRARARFETMVLHGVEKRGSGADL